MQTQDIMNIKVLRCLAKLVGVCLQPNCSVVRQTSKHVSKSQYFWKNMFTRVSKISKGLWLGSLWGYVLRCCQLLFGLSVMMRLPQRMQQKLASRCYRRCGRMAPLHRLPGAFRHAEILVLAFWFGNHTNGRDLRVLCPNFPETLPTQ